MGLLLTLSELLHSPFSSQVCRYQWVNHRSPLSNASLCNLLLCRVHNVEYRGKERLHTRLTNVTSDEFAFDKTKENANMEEMGWKVGLPVYNYPNRGWARERGVKESGAWSTNTNRWVANPKAVKMCTIMLLLSMLFSLNRVKLFHCLTLYHFLNDFQSLVISPKNGLRGRLGYPFNSGHPDSISIL